LGARSGGLRDLGQVLVAERDSRHLDEGGRDSDKEL
jgi:hypothetical protein